jgi:hypothetical protein
MAPAVAVPTEDIACDCAVHCGAVTIRVPVTMLIKPGAKRATPRYRATVIHNLIDLQKLFRKYPEV